MCSFAPVQAVHSAFLWVLVICSTVSVEQYIVAVDRPGNKQNRCRTEEEYECEELRLRRGSPLVCRGNVLCKL